MNQDDWKARVTAVYPKAQFTTETGDGRTYGDVGQVTAHTGPDMQANVVGVYCPGDYWSVFQPVGDDLGFWDDGTPDA